MPRCSSWPRSEKGLTEEFGVTSTFLCIVAEEVLKRNGSEKKLSLPTKRWLLQECR